METFRSGGGAGWKDSRVEAYLSGTRHSTDLQQASSPDGFAAFRSDGRNMLLLYEAAPQMMQLDIASRTWRRSTNISMPWS